MSIAVGATLIDKNRKIVDVGRKRRREVRALAGIHVAIDWRVIHRAAPNTTREGTAASPAAAASSFRDRRLPFAFISAP